MRIRLKNTHIHSLGRFVRTYKMLLGQNQLDPSPQSTIFLLTRTVKPSIIGVRVDSNVLTILTSTGQPVLASFRVRRHSIPQYVQLYRLFIRFTSLKSVEIWHMRYLTQISDEWGMLSIRMCLQANLNSPGRPLCVIWGGIAAVPYNCNHKRERGRKCQQLRPGKKSVPPEERV